MKSFSFNLKPKEKILNRQIRPFPFEGLCFLLIESSAPFLYTLRSIDTDYYYSDKPILCRGRKELLPFGSYKGRIFSFDFENISAVENHITVNAKFQNQRFADKDYFFREYTLDGLYWRTPIVIRAGEEENVSLTNFRGGHYEVHKIYSTLEKPLSCRVEYRGETVERFSLGDACSFKKPWIFHWPESAMIHITNKSASDLEIRPTDVYFAGYLIRPTEVIEKVAPFNARSSFLIEGISLR